MKTYLAYVRVSTTKQGEQGSSLIEQRSAIEAFARRHNLAIQAWYEERETAAKLGRPIFGRMLADLDRTSAAGIIVHKIDRSARNLKDWAAVGDLIDRGVEVHFAHESLDLNSRGGRLAADVQAVVAADYIRNLRDEVKKGFYGRLKQGLLPLPAPVGYLNQGKGKPKILDPAMAPVVRDAFKLYASGAYSVRTLRDELLDRGLRNARGGRFSISGVADMLKNPFYIGMIQIKRTNELFDGIHEPLVDIKVFRQVQATLASKAVIRATRHRFLFQRLIQCARCRLLLVGERQKGRVYYRCHSVGCAGTSVREDHFESVIEEHLRSIEFDELDLSNLNDMVTARKVDEGEAKAARRKTATAALEACEQRLMRLTDAFLDGAVDRELFQTRKNALLVQRRQLLTARNSDETGQNYERVVQCLELAKSAWLSYQSANFGERRLLLKSTTSNLSLEQKKPVVELCSPFDAIAKFNSDRYGGPLRIKPRTFELKKLLRELTTAVFDDPTFAIHMREPKNASAGRLEFNFGDEKRGGVSAPSP